VSPTLTTFLFETANFLVLAAVLGWLFFKPVRQALADRQAKFESETRLAAKKLAEAEQAQQEINATRANLQAELNEQRAREFASVKKQADELLDEARAIAKRESDISRRLAARMSDTQKETLAQVAAAAAGNTVGHLLEQIRGPELHAALVESACEQLRSLPKEEISPVKVESTQTLSTEQLSKLRDELGSAADGADFRTIDGLGAGIRISTGKGLIDASVSGLSQFARQSLVSEMSLRANNHNPLQDSNDA
jgi:F0F1-type ATP synthase membrane subunit b/b'